MTHASHSLLEPPRWTHAVLRFALSCDAMRDAILGDLHEEFLHDLAEVGVRRTRAIVGAATFPLLALFVVAIGVVVNTMMFSAAQPQSPRATSAAGIGGVALLAACVAIAAIVLCVGPRWRRKRLRGA